MNYCTNHPERKAISICHNCGKEFCEDCLNEGKDYYYCTEPTCQAARSKVIPGNFILQSQSCPNCKNNFTLSEKEIATGKAHCPECEAFIDFNTKPPSFLPTEEYNLLFTSMNQGDIALVISILEDGDFDYKLIGQNFASIDPLIQPAKFYIRNDQFEEASDLLKNIEFNIFGISTRNED